MKKKILGIFIVFVIMIAAFTNIYAKEGMFDYGVFNTAYKLSQESEIELPFFNFFEKTANYDRLVEHSGITFAESTVDIDEKLEGVHVILSQDMVTIKGEIEHGIIYGKNIVVEGKISGDTVLMADIVKITDSAVVDKDLIVVATELTMDGVINGNLIAATSNAVITGIIEKDLRLETTKVDLDKSIINDEVYLSVPEGTDLSIIKVKYPNVIINEIVTTTNNSDVKLTGEDVANIIFDGFKVVIVYTVFSLLLTKKENSISSKMAVRFLEHSTFSVIMSVLVFVLSIIVVILLIILGIFGFGVIAWPVLIAFVFVILLSIVMCKLIVGLVIYEVLKNKVGKYKIAVLAGIYALIYALTQIPVISSYAIVAINILSLAIIIAYIFKRNNTSEFLKEK